MFVLIFFTMFLVTLFFEMIEAAIFNIQKCTLIEKDKQSKSRDNVYSKMLYIKENIKEVMIVILLLDTLVSYLFSFYFSSVLRANEYNNMVCTALTVFFSFFVTFVIIIAKVVGLSFSEKTIKFIGNLFYFVFIAFRPIGKFFNKIVMVMLNTKDQKNITQKGEVIASLDDYLDNNKEMNEELNMAKTVLSLSEIPLHQIMNSRSEFLMVEFSEDIEIMKERLLPLSFKKNIIVYVDHEENIIGTINIQKFFIDLLQNKIKKTISYVDLPEYFLHSVNTDRVLQHFKEKKNKIIFVIEEDGSIIGIVTISDIVQEIIGELDKDEYFFLEQEDGYLVDASYGIRALNRKLNIDFEEDEDFSSISGLIMRYSKKIPKLKESFNIQGVIMIIAEKTKNRIQKILIKKPLKTI